MILEFIMIAAEIWSFSIIINVDGNLPFELCFCIGSCKEFSIQFYSWCSSILIQCYCIHLTFAYLPLQFHDRYSTVQKTLQKGGWKIKEKIGGANRSIKRKVLILDETKAFSFLFLLFIMLIETDLSFLRHGKNSSLLGLSPCENCGISSVDRQN